MADDPGSSFKRPDDKYLEGLKQFWRSLWYDKHDPFCDVAVLRGSDPIDSVDVPANMKVLQLPEILSSLGNVMVRSDYEEAIEDFGKTSYRQNNSVIIVGHPGIGRTVRSVGQAAFLIYASPCPGKTILLYYILVKRLLDRKPTILQTQRQYLYSFHSEGVDVLSQSSPILPNSEEYRNTWALVDINVHVQAPAELISHENSPFYLVMSSSPKPSRMRELKKYGRPGAYWLMNPFTLVELLQASVFLTSISSFVTYVMSQSSTSRRSLQKLQGVRYSEVF